MSPVASDPSPMVTPPSVSVVALPVSVSVASGSVRVWVPSAPVGGLRQIEPDVALVTQYWPTIVPLPAITPPLPARRLIAPALPVATLTLLVVESLATRFRSQPALASKNACPVFTSQSYAQTPPKLQFTSGVVAPGVTLWARTVSDQ